MSLTEVWARAWRERHGLGPGWIVNLEPNFNLTLGAVGVLDGDILDSETTLERRGITDLQPDPDQRRNDEPWQFQSDDQIQVELTTAGKAEGPATAVGNAGWKLKVDFGSNEGASIYGSGMWWNQYADLGLVRTAIVEAAEAGRLHRGESIVVSQQLTGAGVLFSAEGRHAALEADVSADVGTTGTPPIASLSGRLNLVHSTGGAQSQSFGDGAVLAARVLYLGVRGWFWWRVFEASGIRELDPETLELEFLKEREGDGENEYFALI